MEIDRESATELLAAKMGVPSPTATAPADAKPKKAGKAVPKKAEGHDAPDTSAVTDYLKSREGRSMLNTIARGVFSLLKKS